MRQYYPNSVVQMRSQAPNAPPSPATMDIGTQLAVTPQPVTYKPDEHNMPAAFIELIGPEGSLSVSGPYRRGSNNRKLSTTPDAPGSS